MRPRQLSNKAQRIAFDLAGFELIPSRLVRVKKRLLINFQFKAAFLVPQFAKYQKSFFRIETSNTGCLYPVNDYLLMYRLLWSGRKSKYDVAPVYEPRDSDHAIIPNIIDIFSVFVTQAQNLQPDKQFFKWFCDQIDIFHKGMDEYHENLITEYRRLLVWVMDHSSQKKELLLDKWEAIIRPIDRLHQKLKLLEQVNYE